MYENLFMTKESKPQMLLFLLMDDSLRTRKGKQMNNGKTLTKNSQHGIICKIGNSNLKNGIQSNSVITITVITNSRL